MLFCVCFDVSLLYRSKGLICLLRRRLEQLLTFSTSSPHPRQQAALYRRSCFMSHFFYRDINDREEASMMFQDSSTFTSTWLSSIAVQDQSWSEQEGDRGGQLKLPPVSSVPAPVGGGAEPQGGQGSEQSLLGGGFTS